MSNFFTKKRIGHERTSLYSYESNDLGDYMNLSQVQRVCSMTIKTTKIVLKSFRQR
jgi:hypothetical protein